MEYDDIELLGIKETLSSHARPGMVAYMLWELLNDARYSPDEIREITATILEHVEHFELLPDRRQSSKTALMK